MTPRRRKYVKRPDQVVVAVQLALETSGFTYEKWGSKQTCKAGDWIVSNHDEVYTVDCEVFERTYRQVGEGTYLKETPVWAEVATRPGTVHTKEGVTHDKAGDYLLFNEEDGGDGYAIAAENFRRLDQLTCISFQLALSLSASLSESRPLRWFDCRQPAPQATSRGDELRSSRAQSRDES